MAEKSSEVILNKAVMQSLTQSAVTALEKTAEALHTEVVQAAVVPRDTGTLQNEAFFVDYSESRQGNVYLVHSTPYARRLYFHPEYHFSKEKNPAAKGRWLEDWVSGSRKDFVPNAFAAFLKQEGGL